MSSDTESPRDLEDSDARRRSKADRQRVRAERALVARARGLPEVGRIIEFGSHARGDARSYSDLDIAVSCPRATPEQWLRIYHELQEADTLLVIDLHRLEDVSAELRSEIEREGRVIYEQ